MDGSFAYSALRWRPGERDLFATWRVRHMPTGKCFADLNRCGNTLAFVYTEAMYGIGFRQRSTCGVVMTRPMRLIAVMVALGAFAQPLLAFQEGGGSGSSGRSGT